jgi:hypothetical protein
MPPAWACHLRRCPMQGVGLKSASLWTRTMATRMRLVAPLLYYIYKDSVIMVLAPPPLPLAWI